MKKCHPEVSCFRQTHKDEKPLRLCFLFLYKGNSYITHILSSRSRSGSFVTQQAYQLLLLTGRASAVFLQHMLSDVRMALSLSQGLSGPV